MEMFRKLKASLPAAAIVITLFAWSWGLDWVQVEDWTRNGKVLFAVAGIGLLAGVYTCLRFHWSAGLFLAYTILRWVSLRLAPVCLIEVTMVTGCIFAAVFIHQFDRKNLLGNCLAIDGFLQATLGLVEVAGFFPLLTIREDMKIMVWPPIAAHGHPTVLGPYLAVSLAFIPGAFVFIKNTRIRLAIQLAAAATILACIAFTQSTMTYGTLLVVAILGVGFYLGLRAMLKSVAVLAAVGAVVLFMDPVLADPSGRLVHWKFAWENVTPLGHGPGLWKPVQAQMLEQQWQAYRAGLLKGEDPPVPPGQLWDTVHMDPLQGLFEWGWLGMAPLFAGMIVLFTIIWKGIRLRRRELFPFAALVAGLGADSCGNFILHTMPAGGLFAIGAIYLFRYEFEDPGVEAIKAYLREGVVDE